MLDRPAVALRNVALSALIILIVAPESLIDVGFQMSYAAVVGLVSVYEMIREREQAAGPGRQRSVIMVVLLFFGGIVMSTLIASLTVAPFAAYHFHTSQQYAVLANLIAIPICNVAVMPAALLVLVAMPFGLEAWPVYVMGWGIEAMVWCAYTVAALPGAVGRMPEFSTLAFGLMVGGGLWICLWHRRWRLLGLVPVIAGLAIAPFRTAPDLLIGRDGRLVAVRDAGGGLSALGDKSATFELERWLEHDGDGRLAAEVFRGHAFRCDAIGCTSRVRGRVVSVVRHAAALADDCATADIIVLAMPRPIRCGRRALVIDSGTLRVSGAVALSIAADGEIQMRTVADNRALRPWSGNRRTATAVTPTSPSNMIGSVQTVGSPSSPAASNADRATLAADGDQTNHTQSPITPADIDDQ
jgi:competence protein ComEC